MRKKLGCLFLLAGVGCFVGFIVSMFSLTSRTKNTFTTKWQYGEHELGFVVILATVTAESDLRSAEITVRYYYAGSDVRHEAVVSFGKLRKGVNEVEILTSIPWFDPDDPTRSLDSSEGRKPTIIDRDSEKPLTGLYIGLAFFFGTAICWVLGAVLSGGTTASRKNVQPAAVDLSERPMRAIDPFDNKPLPTVSRERPKTQKADLALETLDVKGVDRPWYHGRDARFDALNYTAMVTVHAFDAENFFFADPKFYDEVREELANTGKYKVYDDPDINDFLFCCDMSREWASWEDMLRVVCFDCYDDTLSLTEQRTVDRGRVADVYKMLDGWSGESMNSFYAAYDRLPGETCAAKYRSYQLLSGGNTVTSVESGTPARPKKAVQISVPEVEPIVREADEEPAVVLSADGSRVSVNRAQLLRRQSSVAAHKFDDAEDAEETSALSATERAGKAEAFLDRLDKKTAKAWKRADLEEKAALFRDLPFASRPDMQEGFYCAVYDELGGADENARRDRFERLLKGRFHP